MGAMAPDVQSQPKSLPEAHLEVAEAGGIHRRVRLTQSPFLIGRGAEAGNHLQFSDRRVSRRCAAIVYTDGVFYLEDRGQREGVFVEKQKIHFHPLQDGDTISLGGPETFPMIFHTGRARDSLPRILSRLDQASDLGAGARDLRQLSLLLEATAMLQSQFPVQEVLGAMMGCAMAITDADRGLLLEANAQGELCPRLARDRDGRSLPVSTVQPSQTAVAHALAQRRSVVEGDIEQAADLRDARSVVAQQLRSVIAVPLLALARHLAMDTTQIPATGELLGLLYLDSRRPTAFSRLDLQILEALAREAASVIENTRLIQKERDRQRLEQELTVAREIQQALLPKALQRFRHIEVRGTNRSCLAIGGDYFDLMEAGQDRAAFIIADVSGKGLGAALVTAMVQGAFSSLSLGQEPARIFAHINQFICSHSEVNRYATAFFGIIDAKGALECINIGHLPPLHVRNSRVESLQVDPAIPLGLFPNTQYQTYTVQLDPGDTLVLLTDGITEAPNPQNEMFGDKRLIETVGRHASESVEKVEAAILAAVEQFKIGRAHV